MKAKQLNTRWMTRVAWLAAAGFGLVVGCEPGDPGEGTQTGAADQTSFEVEVYGVGGIPIDGAVVQVGDLEVQTDADGLAVLPGEGMWGALEVAVYADGFLPVAVEMLMPEGGGIATIVLDIDPDWLTPIPDQAQAANPQMTAPDMEQKVSLERSAEHEFPTHGVAQPPPGPCPPPDGDDGEVGGPQPSPAPGPQPGGPYPR